MLQNFRRPWELHSTSEGRGSSRRAGGVPTTGGGWLHILPCAPAGCPGPLQIVAPQPAADVQHLADEKQPGNLDRGKGFRGYTVDIDAAAGDLGGAVALGAVGFDGEV